MIHQHPLAYLLGLEDIALLRAFSGAHDREFTLARLAEVRSLLDAGGEVGNGVEVRPISTREGYACWAATYDEPGNQLLELEQPVVREILDGLAPGIALDAGCGTGRHTAYLAALGPPRSPSVSRCCGARSRDGRRRSSPTTTSRRSTFPASRRTSGHCTASAPQPRTLRTRALRP